MFFAQSYYPESLRKRADTPIRDHYRPRTSTHGYLEWYLSDKIGLADTDWFLSNILPVPLAAVDQVLAHVSPLLYDNSRCQWTGMPRPPEDTEEVDQMYQPFIEVSNGILKACKELAIPLELSDVHWRCDLDKSLTSIGTLADELEDYPKVVASLRRGTDEADWLGWRNQILGLVKEAISKAISRSLYEKLAENLSTWWLRRVHIPVEFRVADDPATAKAGLNQLCHCMREILMAQLDRQFVIGLLVCGSNLSIWLHDRSGLLGMLAPIDIHKEPKKFIHVIMAFSSLEPSRLGWDSTMKIVCKSDGKHRLSTDPDLKLADYGPTVLDTQWAVFIPKANGSTDGEWYTTLRLLNTIRFDRVMYGSTLVWAVWKAGEKEQRLVLKQTWRPSVLLQEAELRSVAPSTSNVCQIIRSVDIGCANNDGAPACVDTKLFIRRGMIGRPPSQPGCNSWCADNFEGAVVTITKRFISARRLMFCFTNRVLTRTLMSTYGWPLTSFRDMRELLETIRDAVAGHRDLWFGGVLHRDVSVDNILICPEENDGGKTRGRLIDFGFSIQADAWADMPKPVPVDDPNAQKRMAMLMEYKEIAMPDSVAQALFSRNKDVLYSWGYQDAILKRWPHLKDKSPLSKEDLFLYDWESPPPAWKSTMVYNLDRKGRQAFLSGEVHSNSLFYAHGVDNSRKSIIAENLTDGEEQKSRLQWEIWDDRITTTDTGEFRLFREDHSAIHDLESFWWIILYICLSRNGPGGAQRDELFQRRGEEAGWLRNIVDCLFETKSEQIRCRNKVELFENLDHLQSFIIPRFHPYFKGLEKLIMEWRTILHFAYETYDEVTPGIVHRLVLAVLDDALKDLQSSPLEQDAQATELTQKEDDRRARDLDKLDAATAELARVMEFSTQGRFHSRFRQRSSLQRVYI
ncbi:hypothetical protein DENSPDRAFT_844489 [Dentipellis sp. KUC8613]|nr:hypothetical protein DENSPDRAFT_844489 [Dentipellis sp. KUC8613]